MVPFAGWLMPVQYTSILQEHRAVRESAGLFDVSHMGEVTVSGPQAATFLDALVPNHVAGLHDGKALYTCMCNEDGGTVDDLIIYRFAADRFFLCVNAGNASADIVWIKQHAANYDCAVEDVSGDYALIALQGPQAIAILKKLIATDAIPSKRFTFSQTEMAGATVIVSRTGYTGEDGVEIYCPVAQADTLARLVMDAGQDHRLTLCGLGARDSLRLEAGYPLYGHELGPDISPLQAGLGWTVKLTTKGDFIGRAALEAEQANGPTRRIVHFTLEDRRIARQGTAVLCGDKEVGAVVSGTLSPILNKPIGSALIASDADDKNLQVSLRGNPVSLNVKKPPLHK